MDADSETKNIMRLVLFLGTVGKFRNIFPSMIRVKLLLVLNLPNWHERCIVLGSVCIDRKTSQLTKVNKLSHFDRILSSILYSRGINRHRNKVHFFISFKP